MSKVNVRTIAKRGSSELHNEVSPAEITIHSDEKGELNIECDSPFCGKVELNSSDIALIRDVRWFARIRLANGGPIEIRYEIVG